MRGASYDKEGRRRRRANLKGILEGFEELEDQNERTKNESLRMDERGSEQARRLIEQ